MSFSLFCSLSLSLSLSLSVAPRQKQAEATPHTLHAGAAEWAGALLQQDTLPGHLYARGDRNAHWPHWVPRSGESHTSIVYISIPHTPPSMSLSAAKLFAALLRWLHRWLATCNLQRATCNLPPVTCRLARQHDNMSLCVAQTATRCCKSTKYASAYAAAWLLPQVAKSPQSFQPEIAKI